jgi:hypothetical protein
MTTPSDLSASSIKDGTTDSHRTERAISTRADEQGAKHFSDCAVHNAPAYEPGPCDCGGVRQGHTPGPWEVRQRGSIVEVAPVGADNLSCSSVCLITNCFDPANPDHDQVDWYKQNSANARLIAAAPDMLEALTTVRRFVEAHDHDETAPFALGIIDAAISKATQS